MPITGTDLPYYLESGGGDTAVLMLHGIGGGHQAFHGQMQPLAQAGYRALSWDMPGYGYTRSIEPYDFASLADAAIDLITLLDMPRLILLGHSMGGMVAQEVVARRPELVAGLVLAGTSAAFGKPDGAWQERFIAERTAPIAAGKSMRELAEQLVGNMVSPDAIPERVAAAITVMAAVPAITYCQALGALVHFDQRAALARIAVPTLLIAGDADRNAPPDVMQKMAQRIPGAQYVCIPHCGHLMNFEQPEAFNAALLHFLHQQFPLS